LTSRRGAPHAALVLMPLPVRARVATSAAFGVQGLVFAALLTRVPALKDKLSFTDGQLTLLLAVVPVIAGVGSVLADRLAARYGSAAVLRAFLVGACLAAALVALSSTRLTIYLALAGYGLAVGAVDATMNMQGVAVQARYGRSIMNGFHAAYSLAAILGALYTAAVAGWLPVEASTAVVASAGALGTVIAGRWLPVAPVAPHSGVLAVAPVSRAVHGPGGDHVREPGLAASDRPAVPDGAVPWRWLLPIGVVLGCVYVADSGVSNWSAVYLRDTLRSAEGVAALGYAAYQACALLGRMAGDRLVGRHGAVPVVRAALVVAVGGLLAVLAAGSPWLAIAGFGVTGLGASVLVPLSFSAAGRLDGGRGTAVARVNLFNYAGFLVGAPLVGAVGATVGMRVGWLAPLLLLAAMVTLARQLDP
jgi:MFS family permease